MRKETNAISPPANTSTAHSAHMERFKEKNKKILRWFGLNRCDIGTHSNREGASIYVALGATDGPSVMTICNRAKQDISKVLGTYQRYESADDQYFRWIVVGHSPSSSSKFA